MTLTSVPFHIRRSNKQLVDEYAKLYEWTRVSVELPKPSQEIENAIF